MTERQRIHELLNYGINSIERNLARVESLLMSHQTYKKLLELDLIYDCFEYHFDDEMEFGIVEFVPEKVVHPKWMQESGLVNPVERQMVDVFGDGACVIQETKIVDIENNNEKSLGQRVLKFGIEE